MRCKQWNKCVTFETAAFCGCIASFPLSAERLAFFVWVDVWCCPHRIVSAQLWTSSFSVPLLIVRVWSQIYTPFFYRFRCGTPFLSDFTCQFSGACLQEVSSSHEDRINLPLIFCCQICCRKMKALPFVVDIYVDVSRTIWQIFRITQSSSKPLFGTTLHSIITDGYSSVWWYKTPKSSVWVVLLVWTWNVLRWIWSSASFIGRPCEKVGYHRDNVKFNGKLTWDNHIC